MLDQTQVNTTNVEVPFQVMTKNPKTVAQGKRLAEWNSRNKKERMTQEAKTQESAEAVIVIGVLGLLGYYVYQRGSPEDNNDVKVIPVRSVETRANKSEME